MTWVEIRAVKESSIAPFYNTASARPAPSKKRDGAQFFQTIQAFAQPAARFDTVQVIHSVYISMTMPRQQPARPG